MRPFRRVVIVPLEMAEKGLAKIFGDVFSVAFEEMFAELALFLKEAEFAHSPRHNASVFSGLAALLAALAAFGNEWARAYR